MANYADSRWPAFQYKLDELMNKPEFKHSPSPTLMLRLRNTDFLVPASEKERLLGVKQSDQDTVEINIIKKQAGSTASARAAAHTGSINDSEKTTVSFTTYTGKFKYSIKGSDRTIWSVADQVSKQIRSQAIAIHAAIESDMITALNTNKNQSVISATPSSGEWDGTNFIFGILGADEDLWMQKLKGFMREQYYEGGYDAVVDEYLLQKAQYLTQQGGGNQTNLGWQMEGLNLSVSQGLTLPDSYLGSGFIAPSGSLGVLPWIPELNRTGYGSVGAVGGLYTKIPDPLGSGLTFAVHEYSTAADNESNAGETQDVDIQVELSVDLGPVDAPMSTSNANPVNKFGILQ